jgi:serpin B
MTKTKLINCLNTFSFKLFSDLCVGRDENFFISPFSIFTSLLMIFDGARNTTQSQLAALLNLAELSSEQVKIYYEEYKTYAKYMDSFQINSVNKIFMQQSFELNKEFCSNLEKYFLTEISQLDFCNNPMSAHKINEWVSEKSNNKINNIVSESDFSHQTRLILIDTLYFKASWSMPFDKQYTTKQNFHLSDGSVKQVDMMIQEDFFHLEINPFGLKASLCTLPYKYNSLLMTIVLPDRETNILEVEKSLEFKHLIRGTYSLVRLSMPKFQMNSKKEVKMFYYLLLNLLFPNFV